MTDFERKEESMDELIDRIDFLEERCIIPQTLYDEEKIVLLRILYDNYTLENLQALVKNLNLK